MSSRRSFPIALLIRLTQWALGRLRPRLTRRIRTIQLFIYLLQA